MALFVGEGGGGKVFLKIIMFTHINFGWPLKKEESSRMIKSWMSPWCQVSGWVWSGSGSEPCWYLHRMRGPSSTSNTNYILVSIAFGVCIEIAASRCPKFMKREIEKHSSSNSRATLRTAPCWIMDHPVVNRANTINGHTNLNQPTMLNVAPTHEHPLATLQYLIYGNCTLIGVRSIFV